MLNAKQAFKGGKRRGLDLQSAGNNRNVLGTTLCQQQILFGIFNSSEICELLLPDLLNHNDNRSLLHLGREMGSNLRRRKQLLGDCHDNSFYFPILCDYFPILPRVPMVRWRFMWITKNLDIHLSISSANFDYSNSQSDSRTKINNYLRSCFSLCGLFDMVGFNKLNSRCL